MDMQSLILILAIGLAAGWLASLIMDDGLSYLGDLVVGVLGAGIGGVLFRVLGISPEPGLGGALVVALCGSVVLLTSFRVYRRMMPG